MLPFNLEACRGAPCLADMAFVWRAFNLRDTLFHYGQVVYLSYTMHELLGAKQGTTAAITFYLTSFLSLHHLYAYYS
jgi:hypothetical protein